MHHGCRSWNPVCSNKPSSKAQWSGPNWRPSAVFHHSRMQESKGKSIILNYSIQSCHQLQQKGVYAFIKPTKTSTSTDTHQVSRGIIDDVIYSDVLPPTKGSYIVYSCVHLWYVWSQATLSSCHLRFAVYVGIIIVRASWGQRSSRVPRQKLLLSRLLACK